MANDSIEERLESTRLTQDPYSALYAIAESLRDGGATQVEVYRPFAKLQQRLADDDDEAFYDAVVEVQDDIWYGRDLFNTVLSNEDVKDI